MKLSLIFASIVILLTSMHSQQGATVPVSVNQIYDDSGQTLSTSGMTCVNDIADYPNFLTSVEALLLIMSLAMLFACLSQTQ